MLKFNGQKLMRLEIVLNDSVFNIKSFNYRQLSDFQKKEML